MDEATTPAKGRSTAATADTPESHVQAARKKNASAEGKQTKKKAQEAHWTEDGVHLFSFPLYELTGQRELVFAGGGGGSAASGVPNAWAVFQWMPTSDSLKRVALVSNGDAIVTNGAVAPGLTRVAVGRGRRVALVPLEEGAAQETETEEADAADEAEQKCCCFDRSGRRLAVGGSGGRLRVLDAASLALLHEERGGDGPLTRLCPAPHADQLAALSAAALRVFQVEESGALRLLARHEAAALSRLGGAQLRGVAFAGTSGAPVVAVGVVSRQEKRSQVALVGGPGFSQVLRVFSTSNDPQTCLCASHDGSLLAAGTAEGAVSVWSLRQDPELVMQTRPHTFFVSGVCFSPDGTHVLSVSGDRSLQTQLIVRRTSHRGTAGLLLLLALLVLAVALFVRR